MIGRARVSVSRSGTGYSRSWKRAWIESLTQFNRMFRCFTFPETEWVCCCHSG